MDHVLFSLENYPNNGENSELVTIVLGPQSDKIVILVEIDVVNGAVDVTLGNGPDEDKVSEVVPEVLRQLADLVQDATS